MTIEFMKKPHPVKLTEGIMNPLFKQWFFSRFKSFSEPQKYSIYNIHCRVNTLVSAATGSGKTLSGFGAILNELIDLAQKKKLEDRTYCVYISPLKALNNDVWVNLINPLKEIEEIAGKELGIRVAVRTGDTTPYEKQKMTKNPPHILITTPESLAIVLSSTKFINHLKAVEWLIVDEIHALAENKRGVHFSLSMERLDSLSPHLTRIGLSATVAPLELVAKYLVGPKRDCKIVDVQFIKDLDLQVIAPVPDLINTTHEKLHKEMYKLLDKLIQSHRTTLIFTNTRAATERVVDYLKEKYPKKYTENIGAHHGSLSKKHRLKIEKRLRNGELKVIVSSTSLELGIDIGYIDLVICLSSPKSVARLLQRAGRSGHKLHAKVKARILVMDRDDMIECSVMLKAAIEKTIDKIHIPTNSLDVLAQQIIGMALERVWDEKEMYDVIKQSYCYSKLTKTQFNDILSYLSGEYVSLEDRHVYAKIWRNEGKIGRRGKMGRVIYMTNIGTIPDESFVTVKIGEQPIGKLDESFTERLRPGDVFVLGGATYKFKFTRGTVAQVEATTNRPPTVPRWVSESLPLSFDLAMGISKFRRLMEDKFINKVGKKETLEFISKYLYVQDITAEAIYNYCKEQYDFISEIPSDRKILIEYYTDDRETKIIFHTLFGRRVNDVLSRAVAFVISKTQKKDVEIGISDNGFFIVMNKVVNATQAFKILRSDKLDLVMKHAVGKSEVMKRRFRHCAGRAQMILRNYKGKKKSVGKQQVSSMILMKALKNISEDFSILKEARREVLEDLMDIDNAKLILKEIRTQIPTPFAFNLVLQGYLDILKIEDKIDFLKRMHNMVTAKISLKGGKRKKIDMFDYKKEWAEMEEKKLQEVDHEKEYLKTEIWNLKKVPGYAKVELVKMIEGDKKIRQSVLDSIEQHKKEIKKTWPKKLQDVVFKRIKELK